MMAFTLLIVAAAVGHGVARWLRLPAIPLLLLAGILVSRVGGVGGEDVHRDVLLLGLTILAFVVGLEMNPRRVGTRRALPLTVGLVQFVALGAAALGAALLLGYSTRVSGYIALAFTASSTLVGLSLLRARKELSEPHGRMTLGVLLLQDLLLILLIPVVARWEQAPADVLLGLGGALLLVGIAYLCLRFLTPLLVIRLRLDDERLLLSVLAVLFLFLGVGNLLGLPLIAGAFLAGMSMSSFPASGILRGQFDPLADFFSALFFAALGAVLGIPSVTQIVNALTFAGLVIVLTPLLVWAVASRFGVRRRPALESGLLLAQTSEFSLVIAFQGLALGHLDTGTFTVIALATALTMLATPFLATDRVVWRLLRLRRDTGGIGPDGAPRDSVLVLGAGENGMVLIEALRSAGHSVVAVDDDPSAAGRLRKKGVSFVLGDAADRAVLRRVGARDARAIVSTLRNPSDTHPALQEALGVPVLVRVFEDHEAEQVRRWGGEPILYADAAAEHFLRWLEDSGTLGDDVEQGPEGAEEPARP
jgi:Kef-type K+ transport system membrane component KefB